jgi:lysophospholipase L1-like esterase
MTKSLLTLILLLLIATRGFTQLNWYSADRFPLLGKISPDTETRYERLPLSLKDSIRKPVWNLGKNCAGLAVRFRSNSTRIAAKWEVTQDNVMSHMTPTGIKGLDLYALESEKWQYVNSALPKGRKNQVVIINEMESKMREYMLYLPLYDGVVSLEIGIDSLSVISQPAVNLPSPSKPVVCYGTSILQGGCATRPGMAHTNILSRWFNREVINLGFSGNARLDYEIAALIATCDASVILLDFVPNSSVQEIEERTEKFYRIIRNRLPDVPIVFIENPDYPKAEFDQKNKTLIRDKNAALSKIFNHLTEAGEKNIRMLSSSGMIGFDGEATVDGVHFTDLGFLRYAEFLYPTLKEFIR